jgi:site-specific DNA-cytosine methylase
MNKTTKVLHVFPLIGGGYLGTEILKMKGYDIENIQTAFSLSGARGNEEALSENKGLDIVYWNEKYEDVECDCITCKGYTIDDEIEEATYKIECKKIEKCIEDNKDLINTADIILSIPPCSTLSMLNSSMKSRCGKYNPASQIIMRCVEFAVKSDIEMFCFENAPRLASFAGVPILEQIEEFISKYPQYSMNVIKTNSIWHGMGQRRERTFVFLWKKSSAPVLEFDIIKNSMLEIIGDINEAGDGYSSEPNGLYQKFLRGLNENEIDATKLTYPEYYKDWEILQTLLKSDDITTSVGVTIKKMENFEDWMENVFEKCDKWEDKTKNSFRKFLKKIHRKMQDGKGYWGFEPLPSYHKRLEVYSTAGIIAKNSGRYVHPVFKRVLTFREEARLMGIPDDFKISLKKAHTITQNVPSFTFAAMIEQYFKVSRGTGFKMTFHQINDKNEPIYVGNNIQEIFSKKQKFQNVEYNDINNL